MKTYEQNKTVCLFIFFLRLFWLLQLRSIKAWLHVYIYIYVCVFIYTELCFLSAALLGMMSAPSPTERERVDIEIDVNNPQC